MCTVRNNNEKQKNRNWKNSELTVSQLLIQETRRRNTITSLPLEMREKQERP